MFIRFSSFLMLYLIYLNESLRCFFFVIWINSRNFYSNNSTSNFITTAKTRETASYLYTIAATSCPIPYAIIR